jgi:gibberellin 3-beta-dioxygenase
MENYQKDMKGLAERLTRLIFESLNISDEEISWLASSNGSGGGSSAASTALQLNSYPSCPEPNQAMGLAPHTDTSLLTILHQSEISGLQVFKGGLGWVPVPPVAGAFVVNIGDILHILSNARFQNALHRVAANGARQRFSVAFFYNPPADYVMSPFYKGSSSGQVPRYRSVAMKEYVGLKAKNLENALSIITT